MPEPILLVRRFKSLRPADAQAEATLAGIGEGETVRATITRPNRRSLKQHRLFWAFIDTVAEQIDWTPDQVLHWMKLATGHCDIVIEPQTGKAIFVPRSISFAKMTQDEFKAFMDAAIDRVHARLLPAGTERAHLVEEIYSAAGETA